MRKKIILIAATAALLGLGLPAYAVEVELSATLVDQHGTTLEDCGHFNTDDPQRPFCDQKIPMTLGWVISSALNQVEAGLKPEDITTRGMLVRRIWKATELPSAKPVMMDLDPRDLDVIRAQLAKLRLNPSTLAQAYELLQPRIRQP